MRATHDRSVCEGLRLVIWTLWGKYWMVFAFFSISHTQIQNTHITKKHIFLQVHHHRTSRTKCTIIIKHTDAQATTLEDPFCRDKWWWRLGCWMWNVLRLAAAIYIESNRTTLVWNIAILVAVSPIYVGRLTDRWTKIEQRDIDSADILQRTSMAFNDSERVDLT